MQSSFLTIHSPPVAGGLACPTVYSRRQACNVQPCPIPCGFTDWSNYSSCTVGCGINGTMMANRTTLTTPMYGGQPCPSPMQLFQYCYSACPTQAPVIYHDLIYWTAFNATMAAVAAGQLNISVVSATVFNATTRAVMASVAAAQIINGQTVFGAALPRTTASTMSTSLSLSVTSSVTAFASTAAWIPGSMAVGQTSGQMSGQMNAAVQTAVTLAGVSATPYNALFFGNISNSAAQGVADAVAAAQNASVAPAPINLGNNVYDPVYQIVYNTVCGAVAVYKDFPLTAKAVGCNVPYITVPPTIVPTDVPGPTTVPVPPGSPIILIVGGIVGFVVCLCIAYICWKFYCGAVKRDVPLMDLNY